MIQGFLKWRESTTTSPSNKHLGIYKCLIIADLYNILPTNYSNKINNSSNIQSDTTSINNNINEYNDKNNQTNKSTPITITKKALLIQHKLINLAILHCHTYDRWQTVHNFFLEKMPGHPLITKLRVIHLYEADWNLVLKYFIAHKLMQTSYNNNTLQLEQAGGRPGQSADSMAIKTILTLESCRLQRATVE